MQPRTIPTRRGAPSLAALSTHEAALLSSSVVASPSDKVLSPISRALGGRQKHKALFGGGAAGGAGAPGALARSQAAVASATAAAAAGGAALPAPALIPPSRELLQRKALRQAFLSGGKSSAAKPRFGEGAVGTPVDRGADAGAVGSAVGRLAGMAEGTEKENAVVVPTPAKALAFGESDAAVAPPSASRVALLKSPGGENGRR